MFFMLCLLACLVSLRYLPGIFAIPAMVSYDIRRVSWNSQASIISGPCPIKGKEMNARKTATEEEV